MWTQRLRTQSRGQVGIPDRIRGGAAVLDRRHLPPLHRPFAAAEARHGLGGMLSHLPHAVYVNHPAAVAQVDVKPGQLWWAGELGLRNSPTRVTNAPDAARSFPAEHGHLFYKTAACRRARMGTPKRPGRSTSASADCRISRQCSTVPRRNASHARAS